MNSIFLFVQLTYFLLVGIKHVFIIGKGAIDVIEKVIINIIGLRVECVGANDIVTNLHGIINENSVMLMDGFNIDSMTD